MLEVREIYKTFNAGTINEKRAMNGVTLTLNEGDFATVIGGNGAGKSTLLNLVAGVYPVDSGSIAIGGQNGKTNCERGQGKWKIGEKRFDRLFPVWEARIISLC